MDKDYLAKRKDAIDKKIGQLKAQKQILESREKDKQRKERTRRLIQIGAIMDNAGMKTVKQADAFSNELKNNPKIKEWFDKLMQ